MTTRSTRAPVTTFRLARVRTGLSRENAAALAALLNRNLTFVAPVDLSTRMLSELCSQIAPELVPVVSAAAAILQDSVKPHVFLGGEQYLLEGYYPAILSQAEYDELQRVAAQTGRRRVKGDLPHVITGLGITVCGYCGRPMAGRKRGRRRSREPCVLWKTMTTAMWACQGWPEVVGG